MTWVRVPLGLHWTALTTMGTTSPGIAAGLHPSNRPTTDGVHLGARRLVRRHTVHLTGEAVEKLIELHGMQFTAEIVAQMIRDAGLHKSVGYIVTTGADRSVRIEGFVDDSVEMV